MSDTVLTDELWLRLEPLIPVRQRRFRYPGRARTSDRAALEGILFAARTGVTWNALPTAAFGVSGATCWRRLADARIELRLLNYVRKDFTSMACALIVVSDSDGTDAPHTGSLQGTMSGDRPMAVTCGRYADGVLRGSAVALADHAARR